MRFKTTNRQYMEFMRTSPCVLHLYDADHTLIGGPTVFVDGTEHPVPVTRAGRAAYIDVCPSGLGHRTFCRVAVEPRHVVPGDLYVQRLTLDVEPPRIPRCQCGHVYASHPSQQFAPATNFIRTCAGDSHADGCPCTRTQESFQNKRASTVGARLFGVYLTRRISHDGGILNAPAHVEIVDFPHYPTRLEQLCALDLAANEYDPPSDTVSFGSVGLHTLRACRVCHEPVQDGPNFCVTCDHLESLALTSPHTYPGTRHPNVPRTHEDLDSQAMRAHYLMERCMEIHARLIAHSEALRAAAVDRCYGPSVSPTSPSPYCTNSRPCVHHGDRYASQSTAAVCLVVLHGHSSLDLAERAHVDRHRLHDRTPDYIRAHMYATLDRTRT